MFTLQTIGKGEQLERLPSKQCRGDETFQDHCLRNWIIPFEVTEYSQRDSLDQRNC